MSYKAFILFLSNQARPEPCCREPSKQTCSIRSLQVIELNANGENTAAGDKIHLASVTIAQTFWSTALV